MDRLKTYYQNLIPDQKQLLKQKAVWIAVVVCIPIVLLLLFLLSTWISSLTTPESEEPAGHIWLALLALYLFLWIIPPFSILTIATLIGTLRQTCYVYKYNDKEIVVYAGKKKQYIKINGEKYDEHNSRIPFFQTVTLTAKMENGEEYQARIPKNKKTSLKANGKILEPIR